jgi:uncharacterized UBP type Zn finger protein
VEGVDAETIRTIQANNRCESNNAVLTRLIGDVDHFVDDAIGADGRGHFLSGYDSEEHEIRLETKRRNGTTSTINLYVYRVN